MTRETIKDVRRLAETNGLVVATWSPGDGTRYRFFPADSPSTDYDSGSGLGTTMGAHDAMEWLRGYRAATLAAYAMLEHVPQYLEHPEVNAIPFVIRPAQLGARIREAIDA